MRIKRIFDGVGHAVYISHMLIYPIKAGCCKRLNCLVIGAFILLAGCHGPLERTQEQALREQLLASHRAYRAAAAGSPAVELARQPSEVEQELTQERRSELDEMSGPRSYRYETPELGKDLQGSAGSNTIAMPLQKAIRLAVENNLDVHQARVIPAINDARLTQAQAAFDAVFFTTFDFQKLDTPFPPSAPTPPSITNPNPPPPDRFQSFQSDARRLTTGIRKQLTTGGQISMSTAFARNFRDPAINANSGQQFSISTFYEANVDLTITQPLLRNFGTDVNRAQIELTENARLESVADLQRQLLTTAADVEQGYWDLVFARQQLMIRSRLLDRTRDDRDQLKLRGGFDVNPVRLTEANSFVEIRRSDVIRARQQVRLASDRLKRLINAKQLSLAGEELILPVEVPIEIPVEFSLLDAVTTALQHRPEVKLALLQIQDASIRQRVADNQRLPELNLSATVRYNGVTRGQDQGIDNAYNSLGERDFIDYLVNLQFEVPIGNRGPEAFFREQQLARRAAVINYQNLAQQVVLDVKDALRNLLTTYELIGAARAARRAAADNLRAIEEQEKAGVALTPEFLLDLKLSTQQRLADSEVNEVQALTDYNIAIARFYQSMGTLLKRNQIAFEDPIGDATQY